MTTQDLDKHAPPAEETGLRLSDFVGASPTLLTKEAFLAIGEALGGRTHWQASLARDVGVSKSQVTRLLNGERTSSTDLADSLKDLLVNNVEELGALLTTPGLPDFDSDATIQAQALIRAAIHLLRNTPPNE